MEELLEVLVSDVEVVRDALCQHCQVSAAMVFSSLSQGAEAGRQKTSRSQFTSQVESI